MAYTKGIKITDGDLGEDYACGKCGTVMYGDEVICTRCKTLNTFSPPIQNGLTEENVDVLRATLEKMSKSNPALEYRFFKDKSQEPKTPDITERLDSLHEKMDSLTRKIDLIFGGHVLMDGTFKKIPE